MAPNHIDSKLRCAAGAALLALVLSGCGKPPTPGEPTAAPPAPAAESPAAPAAVPPPDAAAPAPSPAPAAPPPTEPSAVPKATAANEPSLDSMRVAQPSAKISVPVDLRYQFDSEPLPNQPVTLHLAAVSRVTGANLRVTVKPMAGLQFATGPLELQKTTVSSVYRQQLSVTRSAAGPDHLRVLVTMDMAEGNGFGYFTVPLTSGNTPQKQDSVKQR
jgi:hypothetical protein